MSLKRIRVAPNHSFNRTQWCMPPSGPPFHYGPAGVLPHCADERARVEPTSRKPGTDHGIRRSEIGLTLG